MSTWPLSVSNRIAALAGLPLIQSNCPTAYPQPPKTLMSRICAGVVCARSALLTFGTMGLKPPILAPPSAYAHRSAPPTSTRSLIAYTDRRLGALNDALIWPFEGSIPIRFW